MVSKVIFLTAGTTSFTIPVDWSSTNKIEVIGGGAGGKTGAAAASGGGGGGQYRVATNITGLSGSIQVSIGASVSAETNGNNTWWNGATFGAATLSAQGGQTTASGTGGVGGSTGTGGSGSNGGAGGVGGGTALTGGGGGGGAGPGGVGGLGGNGDNTAAGADFGGGGGSGAGTATGGGTGGNGTTSAGLGGTNADGGGPGGNGGAGAGVTPAVGTGVWTSTHLADATTVSVVTKSTGGGGGGGGSASGAGGLATTAHCHGGGGGGAGNGTGGSGGAGLIVITYTPLPEVKFPQLALPTVRVALTTAVIAASGLVSPWFTDGACGFQEGAFQSGAFQICTDFPKWYEPFSEPTRSKDTTAVRASGPVYTTFIPTTETVTVDKWFVALAQPTLRKGTAPGVIAFQPFPVTVAGYEWRQPLSQPTLRVWQAASQPAVFFVGSDTTRDARGYAPLSEPTRFKGLGPQLQDAVRFDPFPRTVANYEWRQPLSQPTRREVRVQPDALTWSTFTPAVAEVVTVDKWFASFAEQSRPKIGLAAYLQQALAFHPFPITVAAYEWRQPLSQPTLRIWPAAQQRAVFFDPFPITVAAYQWQQPLSEPIRIRRTAEFPALSYSYFVAAAETVTVDKWYAVLSEPVRRKPTVHPDAVTFHPFPITVAAYEWRQPLSQPTLRVWPAAQQLATFWSGFTPAPVTAWIGPFAQPTYRIRLAEYQATFWSTFTPVAFPGDATSLQTDWFNELQQPTRTTWSPNGMTFTWLAPSGEPGPVTTTGVPFDSGYVPGFYYDHWRKLQEECRRLRKRCEEDAEECEPLLVELCDVTTAVIASPPAKQASPASLARLTKALASVTNAKRMATVQQGRDRIYKELMVINAELMQIRAAEDEEEEAIALLMLL